VTPLFIFSLPRCGSTFLQRLLASNETIATTSEPWLLLPQLYALGGGSAYADYGHYLARQGIDDFCATLPHGRADYDSALAEFMRRLYSTAAGDEARYFLDKTPRYHLVVDDIMRIFPEARCIFLWRNPLAMLASMARTFGEGRWIMYVLKVSLYQGLENLVEASQRYADRSIVLQYEQLVSDPVAQLARLSRYLDLELTADGSFSAVELGGALGDKSGVAEYRDISTQPIGKWRQELANPLRKYWCRRYLDWIGRDRLAVMGYELADLQAELDALPGGHDRIFSDLLHLSFSPFYSLCEAGIMRDKLARLSDWKHLVAHR